jgi:hypothetical protein
MLQRLSFVCPMKVNHDGPFATRPRPVMCSQNSPDEVFVDICLRRATGPHEFGDCGEKMGEEYQLILMA